MKLFSWVMLSAMLLLPTVASAAPIVPTDPLVPLPVTEFGGDGIANHSVAVSTFVDGSNTITLGLSAHERHLNQIVTNDGAGNFFAAPGSNFGDPTFNTMPSSNEGATWSFGYYINVDGPGGVEDYMVDLLYDFDPGVGTEDSTLGIIDLDAAVAGSGTSLIEGSQNLLFSFLTTGIAGVVTPPTAGPSFDPNAIGEYSFALVVSNGSGELGRSAINVNTVPEPSSMALLATGAIGFLGYRRRQRKLAKPQA